MVEVGGVGFGGDRRMVGVGWVGFGGDRSGF